MLRKNPKGARKGYNNNNKGKGGRNTASGKGEFSGQSNLGHGSELSLSLKSIPLFPARYKGLLRYSDSFTLTSTAGVVASYVLSCNGLYDPNITGTGHQPAGFDQMMLSYEHYTVVRSRCECTFLNTSATTAPTCALSVRAASSPVSVIQQNIEDGLIKTSRLYGANVKGAMQTLASSVNIAQFGGLVQVLDNTDYRGNIAANPAEQSYYHVQTWSTSGDTTVVIIEVVLEFEAWFTEPRTLSQSVTKQLSSAVRSEERKLAQR